jgi:hypothetical protein
LEGESGRPQPAPRDSEGFSERFGRHIQMGIFLTLKTIVDNLMIIKEKLNETSKINYIGIHRALPAFFLPGEQ